MAIELVPLPLPPSADASKFANFGREVKNIHPGNFTPEEFKEIQEALYKVRFFAAVQTLQSRLTEAPISSLQYDALLFRNVDFTPEQQYALTKVRRTTAEF